MKRVLLALGLWLGALAPTFATVPTTLVGNANYTILNTDQTVITTTAFTASRTWTLPSAAGTCVGGTVQGCNTRALEIIDQAGAITSTNTLVLAPASGETINGSASNLTITTAYSRVILLPLTGSNWFVQIQQGANGGQADVQVFTASGSWTPRTGTSYAQVFMCAGGGGGGAGFGVASGTAAAGAAGGGGGDCKQAIFKTSDLTTPVTITVGAGGIAGTLGSLTGQVGGNTCFGGTSNCGGTPLLIAYGGGGGKEGVTGAGTTGGGGGGGCSAVGSVGTTSGGAAGDACSSAGGTGVIGVANYVSGGGAGGAGAPTNGAAGVAGGINWTYGGPGGGAGGGITTVPAATAGGNGGTSMGCPTATTGGTAGVAGGTSTGSSSTIFPGCGGAGGGSQLGQTGAPGAGGAGTRGGGGGGGGSHCTSGGSCTAQTVSNGGAGGAGFVTVVSF